ncbi:MAG: YbaK/EbsC family protein, partial [Chloroflexota bacterium]|nr:YbaK/EbsC family protein [Chloroflexota bacterium]
ELTGLDRVRHALELLQIDAAIVSPGVPMPTVPLAAEAIGCAPDQIIKTVVFSTTDGSAVIAIANGTSRIDRQVLASVAGVAKLKLADPTFVLERTGYPAGGVSPVGIRDDAAQIVIDRRVLEQEVVYGGAGTEDDLLRLRTPDLVQVTRARIAEIVN